MSLDVYLKGTQRTQREQGSGIFVRRNGATVEITRDEWDRLNPGMEPVTFVSDDTANYYSANITHNLGGMAEAAGIYKELWHPDEIGMTKASQLIDPLKRGLDRLIQAPETFKKLNPENGWGDYDGLVSFVEKYINACILNPEASVSVSR